MKKIILLTTILSSLFVVALTAAGKDKGKMLFEGINLTKEQSKSIKAIKKNFKKDMKAAKKKAGKHDCKACGMKKMDKQKMKKMNGMHDAIAKVLDETQKKQFYINIENKKVMHEKVMKVKESYKEKFMPLKEKLSKANGKDKKALEKEMKDLKMQMCSEIADAKGLDGKDKKKFIKYCMKKRNNKKHEACTCVKDDDK